MRRTTIEDIAKKLGISVSTVSRALKNHPDISEKTKQKVMETAKELKYMPNNFAISLKMQHNSIIGVIVPEITHYFFSSVIKGIEEFCYKQGFSVILAISNEDPEIEQKNIQLLLNGGAAGVLMSRTKNTNNFAHIQQLIDFDVPVVFFDRYCKELKIDRVIVNDEYAAYMAVEYLIKTGCKKIVLFKVPEDIEISRRRQTGYEEALLEYNLPFDSELVINCDNYDAALVETQKLIDKDIQFDAIFSVNDNTAAGALEVLKRNNIKIPDEVSVMGFSNDLISQVISPKLSTVEQNGFEMGYTAAQLLIDRINSDKILKVRTEVIPTKLIIRDSTKKIN